ncbi:unnamed protein product [marine sediment metagenome]|uniref:Carboxypeptidase regulatory-like domain-containing protein n=1 Tax=marine sediment metagenome TaxID=412755 RepID=X0Y6H7_9ZZZZ
MSAVIFVGCGDSGPKRYPVTGEVTWEGQPLPDGDILFTPVDGGVPDAGKVIDGKFEMQAVAGPKNVSIFATRETGEVDATMGVAPRESYLPVRYNDATKLTADVDPAAENQFVFPLTSEP